MAAPHTQHRDFLVEIGTEELPPKSLHALIQAFAEGIERGLKASGVGFETVEKFATPRRLAVRVSGVAIEQPAQEVKRLGPAISNSYDANGQPTKAALGFAASCGVGIGELTQAEGPKGKVLAYAATRPGERTSVLLPGIVSAALKELPIAKRMRWGSGEAEFVRPVHWVVMLFGTDVVEAEILGIASGSSSRGHRFHAPNAISIPSPAAYEAVLRDQGKVLVDLTERRERILSGVQHAASAVGGSAVIGDALLDEVCALVEWPVPIAGQFETRFLLLPAEVLVAVMQDHQRYFPVRDSQGVLLPWFIAVANIESLAPDKVRSGNERVIRPRLADAAFFWETDQRVRLDAKREGLKSVTFQQGLGSLFDKSERVKRLAALIASRTGADSQLAARAADLCKCDLLSLMVGEFPELQGIMGQYYARHDGESEEVATAIAEHYLPKFAGDGLPGSQAGMAVAIADRVDTITGIFAIGQKPSGTRDPFGLRRAALGVLRLLIEKRLDLDLLQLIDQAADSQPAAGEGDWRAGVYDYIMERLRAYYLEQGSSEAITAEMFDAVLANRPGSPLDFDARIRALQQFLRLDDAPSLAAANKRIANILRKSESSGTGVVNSELLAEPAEKALFDQVLAMERATAPLISRRDYAPALSKLAGLRSTVDDFFDAVMVMADDQAVRENRLALLARLRKLFLHVADLSRLPG
ncbi:MAG: glycine--tRNA ligase subunit beta [Steroidobacteraceae bacterium]